MNDTSLPIEQRMAALMAARSPVERLRMASRMFDTGRTLLLAGLKRQNKGLSEQQLRVQMFLRMYGDDFTDSEIRRIVSCIFPPGT